MKIIRDEVMGGLAMIPLLIVWGIRRCNVEGCTEKPNTIVGGLGDDIPVVGFCEEHYQAANVPGGAHFDLAFDDFDAFKPAETEAHADGA